jgi:hypothetical protein
MQNNQVEMLEVKTTINQIQTVMGNIITREHKTEERMSEVEDKIEKLLYVNNHEEKTIIHINNNI